MAVLRKVHPGQIAVSARRNARMCSGVNDSTFTREAKSLRSWARMSNCSMS